MSQVFVSYVRSDEVKADAITKAVRNGGYTVWRDDELPVHRAYAEVIEERLKLAKAVLVLWSAEAASSQWVRAEAEFARGAGTLVQATLDGTLPPLPFNQIQCADLSDWQNDCEHAGWRKLAGSVADLTGARSHFKEPRHSTQGISVCVLPFANMSGDPEQEYFSDGISEDITTDLSKVSALEVIARNTAFQYKGRSMDVSEVARTLGVTHILEGSVRKVGSRVRITAQLIEGRSGAHLWAERFDRDLTDIFAIQDEISEAIVRALKLQLLTREKKAIEDRGTSDVQAYNLYLMARRYWVTGNWGDTRQLELVIRICRRALDIDPAYARPWGLLAIVQSILHFTFGGTDDDGLAAADRALSLDSSIAEAHCVRARHFYERGSFDEADKELARALEIDPASWEANREAARIYYFQRRFPEAINHFENAVRADQTDFHSWGMLASAYEALDRKSDALHAAQRAVEQSERVLAQDPTNGAALGMGAAGLGVLGDHARATEWVERALLISPDNVLMRYNFACLFARDFNDVDRAMLLLEPLIPTFNASAMKAVIADPDLDVLRGDSRFQLLTQEASKRLGLTSAG
jgi:adenylate cyclase